MSKFDVIGKEVVEGISFVEAVSAVRRELLAGMTPTVEVEGEVCHIFWPFFHMSENATVEVVEVARLGNLAKSCGDYDLANDVFAFLFECFLTCYHGTRRGHYDEDKIVGSLDCFFESADNSPSHTEENLYYDLFVLKALSEFGGTRIDINIPIPLLEPDTLVSLMMHKNIPVVEKQCHDREVQPSDTAPLKEMFDSLLIEGRHNFRSLLYRGQAWTFGVHNKGLI